MRGIICPWLLRLQFHKIHRTVRVTPAMTAGVTDRLREVADLVAAWEAHERGRKERRERMR
jgi:hypothetical protein